MQRIVILCLLAALLLAGCNTASEPTATPFNTQDLIQQAAANVGTVQTLRLTVDRTGADYYFNSPVGTVLFNRLEGQYVAPDIIQAKVRVALGKLPVELEVFAQGEKQWMRGVFTNMLWQQGVFAENFNPQTLIVQKDSGVQKAMGSLKDVKLTGDEQLEDGTAVYHLSATADGPSVSALIANIVQMTGEVKAEVFIDKQNQMPLKFAIVQPDTATEAQPDPTTWVIELYDFNAAPDLTPPDAQS